MYIPFKIQTYKSLIWKKYRFWQFLFKLNYLNSFLDQIERISEKNFWDEFYHIFSQHDRFWTILLSHNWTNHVAENCKQFSMFTDQSKVLLLLGWRQNRKFNHFDWKTLYFVSSICISRGFLIWIIGSKIGTYSRDFWVNCDRLSSLFKCLLAFSSLDWLWE